MRTRLWHKLEHQRSNTGTGSGKSSLISMCRLNMITEGKILIDGKDTTSVNWNHFAVPSVSYLNAPFSLPRSFVRISIPHWCSQIRTFWKLYSVHLSTFLKERGGLDMKIQKAEAILCRTTSTDLSGTCFAWNVTFTSWTKRRISIWRQTLIQNMIRSHPVSIGNHFDHRASYFYHIWQWHAHRPGQRSCRWDGITEGNDGSQVRYTVWRASRWMTWLLLLLRV